jgi:hypothetical protein
MADIAYGCGVFTSGLGYDYGDEWPGCAVSGGVTGSADLRFSRCPPRGRA